MDILLIAGLWLDGSAWDDVVPELEALGHRPVPLTLPGQGDGAASATLDDQVAAVLSAVDLAAEPPHGRGALRRLHPRVAGRRRPTGQGGQGCPHRRLPVRRRGGLRRLLRDQGRRSCRSPAGGRSREPDSADLDEEAKRTFEAAAIPVPEGVTKGVVHLGDDRRFDVPVVLVCPEFDPAQAQAWIDDGDAPRARQGQAPRPGRHRLGALAHGHQAEGARPAPLGRRDCLTRPR